MGGITVYINEEHLGDATREEAIAVVAWLKANTGWNVEYGNDIASFVHLMNYDYIDEFEADFNRALDAVSAEVYGAD